MKTTIEMAREAGLERGGYWEFDLVRFEHFVALVRADEREACAKVCDARYMGDNNREDMEAKKCAEAIRERGQA
jgi:hypothetical protein